MIDKTYYEQNKEKILEKQKEYYNKNKNKILNKQKEFYENNKEKILERQFEYNKEWSKNNKDKIKEYYENNKEKILEKNRVYQKEFCENNKELNKIYYKNNKKIIKEKHKKYYNENKDQIIKRTKENSKCRSCKLFYTSKKTNYLCSYCNPDKATRQKTKEMAVKKFLEDNNYTFIYNKKCNLDKSCQTYYPDFLIDCNKFFVILECDEDGHKSYDKQCERIRENNICFALGLPCIFIRFNPDKKKIKMKTKQKVLKSYLDFYIKKETCDNVVEYLFY